MRSNTRSPMRNFLPKEGIFIRHDVDFSPTGLISHMRVQNSVMLMVFNGQTIQQVSMQTGKKIDIPLSLPSVDRIAYLHLDYTGVHAIASSVNGENFYMHTKSSVVKPLRRLKGMTISAVGWNLDYVKSAETSFIVLGTTKGIILETNVTKDGNMNYLKSLVSNLNQDNKELAVTDLFLHQCSDEDEDRYLLLVCMPGRLFALSQKANPNSATQQTGFAQPMVVGSVWSPTLVEQTQGAVLQSLFNFPDASSRPRCHSHAATEQSGPPSALAMYPIPLNASDRLECCKYSWMSAEGLSMGVMDPVKMAQSENKEGSGKPYSPDAFDMLIEEAYIKHKRVEGRFDYPLDIALTEYHLVLLYTTRIVAMSLLDQKIAFEEVLPVNLKAVGMTRDATSQFIWVFTESKLLRYRPSNETRHIWRVYLERKDFAKARKITKQMIDVDPAPHQMVIKKEAEKFIADNNYADAADILAESSEPFESIVLKFLKDGAASRNGLKRYLELKLKQMDQSEDKIRRDILVIWLLEIQLGELAELRRNKSSNIHQNQLTGTLTHREAEVEKLREELHCFLNRPIVTEAISANKTAVYRMISSHIDFETQLYLANKLKDHDVVIKILLLQRKYERALEVMVQQAKPEFFYKYAPELISEIPMELVKALIDKKRILQPNRLLPVFYKCFDASSGTGVKPNPKVLGATFAYLENIIFTPGQRIDPAIYNFIIHLHATFKPTATLEFLKRFGKNRRTVPYDVENALHICVDKKLMECCVFLYSLQGQYEKAVKLALTISLDLAKECAQELSRLVQKSSINFSLNPFDDISENDGPSFDDLEEQFDSLTISPECLKQVWLEIAKTMIDRNKNVDECLALLKESNDAIKIQDILIFFPDFTRIEHFKEPLCECLREHSAKIKEFQNEMKATTEMTDEIREEVEKRKSSSMVVKASDKCCKCKDVLLTRPFFAFACRHFFHKDCLERHMIKEEFSQEEAQSYTNLLKNEKILRKKVETMKIDGKPKDQAISEWKSVEEQLRDLLADDCPMCGLRIVESIDKPFFNDSEYEEELKRWSFT
ncbi:pep3/Vps18/deep orange family domain-containing protein [Ditylenchus destructor]|nr:pep3/Vps18/deep orange family domain-containing protein [Ditylenchus destructor]